MKQKLVKVHPADNVLVALTNLSKGEVVTYGGEDFTLQNDIPAKHKFVTTDMEAGGTIEMYGVTVGKAQEHISKGGIISTANIKHAADPFFYRKTDFTWTAPDVSKFSKKTFNGYHRSNGDVGTANYWLFIPTVFCENRNMDVIREALHNELGYAVTAKYKQYAHQLVEAFKKGEDISAVNLSPDNRNKAHRIFENVDGIKFLNHQGGCGGIRQDAAILGKLLAAYANHPNVGGVTVFAPCAIFTPVSIAFFFEPFSE